MPTGPFFWHAIPATELINEWSVVVISLVVLMLPKIGIIGLVKRWIAND
jgi:hypothetical protein